RPTSALYLFASLGNIYQLLRTIFLQYLGSRAKDLEGCAMQELHTCKSLFRKWGTARLRQPWHTNNAAKNQRCHGCLSRACPCWNRLSVSAGAPASGVSPASCAALP